SSPRPLCQTLPAKAIGRIASRLESLRAARLHDKCVPVTQRHVGDGRSDHERGKRPAKEVRYKTPILFSARLVDKQRLVLVHLALSFVTRSLALARAHQDS
ncbi:hypothetical protein C8R46DRAFT_1343785, partial [Mycena filopes]